MRLISPWNLFKVRSGRGNIKDVLPDDGRRDAFRVVEHEPLAVTEGGALVRSLVEEPY